MAKEKEEMNEEDLWAESVMRRHMRRTGIRRVYNYPNGFRGDCYLLLEFVIWGRVLFYWRLWRTKKGFNA